MAGMRDRLIHAYFGVDYELVWDVITNKIPQLKHEIAVMIDTACNSTQENKIDG